MIEVEHLSKLYGSTSAIADVTFSVEPGEILGFLGPNGAGKTTTMRILSGYLPATSGTAKVAGFEVHEDSMAVRQRIGYLPESPPLYPDMTVEGYLNFVAQIKGVNAGDRPQRIQSALTRCNLLEKRKTIIRKLSKGFRQRVGIAQAIVHDPPVIILDEPTVGLDPRQIIEVRNLIKNLAGDHTVILSTHILPEVSMTCSRVAIINHGQVVATNTPESLMTQLMGSSGYELEVEGEFAAIQQCLQAVSGVKTIEPMLTDLLPQNRLKIKVVSESETELGSELATALVSHHLKLYEMRRVQASLETVFLQLTTEETPVENVDEVEPSDAAIEGGTPNENADL
ncbi:ABC transporter ATP-binding protein [Phormidesmis priestleyi ULC007]|uniref:ABC transporter ATP-binding protein n=1 Tax=Phormidesmis priestleyi ULC007 TaxID=1920490 RepID=A0A2T1D4E7_9CYAN|nr:ABC transporter ATP-binding protein [Phormidesmis priestleyi]PSB15395.1 ABC transporter ATP-binding protein [Phormidesmis priestleyi ULC007]PZO46087.1 MAG: ABC transporter ATP-binding protein [Phormidesmis priestleyi]